MTSEPSFGSESWQTHSLEGGPDVFQPFTTCVGRTASYFVAWTAYGLLAYGVFRLVTAVDPGFLAWDEGGPYGAGGAIAAAGLYQLPPPKEVCLRHCRGRMHFILHGCREGRIGALRMGAEHRLYCVRCRWGLMVILFTLGVRFP